ncbi:hypothetical protein [Kibdelosporangium aridum]|nr:hypothetical protein [Kibdelosporangium aridum]
MTSSGKSDPTPTMAPRIVNVAFWLTIVGFSILILVAALALALKDQSITLAIESQAQRPADQRISPEQIRQGINVGVWLNLAFAVIIGLLAAYMVRQVRAGDRKSRFRFTILAILFVLLQLLLHGLNIPLIPLAGILCVLTSVGLLFSGTSTRFLSEE